MISIVIPVFGGAKLTRACLESIRGRSSGFEVEIILVDDASPDEETRQYMRSLSLDPGVRVIFQEENRGFASTCNHGFHESRGEIVIFLNNDTEVCDGWLDPLVRAFEDSEVGVAGSLLLYPGGRLIQHGGIGGVKLGSRLRIFHLGQYWRICHYPQARETKVVFAVTGACMAVRKVALGVADPFDTGFRNGYEDVDLCLRMRENGWKIMYCGESCLIHHESVSAGRFKSEEANARRFANQWDKVAMIADVRLGRWELKDRRARREYLLSPSPACAARIASLAEQMGCDAEAELWNRLSRGRFLKWRREDSTEIARIHEQLGLLDVEIRGG